MARRPAFNIVLRAIGLGLAAALVLPLVLLFVLLGTAHLAGSCGPGSSGGCEMGAGVLAIVSVIPAFVIGVCVSLYLDLWRDRG